MEGLVGVRGEVVNALEPTGTVMVQGEIWNAESIAGQISKGEKIIVKKMKNLKLYVEPITNE